MTDSHLPYSFVNSENFKDFTRALHPGYDPASVETMKGILKVEVKQITNALKLYLQQNLLSGGLSADGWTSAAGDSYFGLILHFLDQEGIWQALLLKCLPKDEQTAADLEFSV